MNIKTFNESSYHKGVSDHSKIESKIWRTQRLEMDSDSFILSAALPPFLS